MSSEKYPKKITDVKSKINDDEISMCFICSSQSLPEQWKYHKKKEEHLLTLPYFTKNFADYSSDQIKCKLCKDLIPKNLLKNHAVEKHQLMPWYRPADEFVIYFKNFIRPIGNYYYCYLCTKKHKSWHLSLTHVGGKKHQKRLKTYTRLININKAALLSDPDLCKDLAINDIYPFKFTQLQCFSCEEIIDGYETSAEHIASKVHKDKFAKKSRNDIEILSMEERLSWEKSSDINRSKRFTTVGTKTINDDNSGDNNYCDIKSSNSTRSSASRMKIVLKRFTNFIGHGIYNFYCFLRNAALNETDNPASNDQLEIDTNNQVSERDPLLSEYENPDICEYFKNYIFFKNLILEKKHERDFYCFLCQIQLSFEFFPSNIMEHMEDSNHQNLMKENKNIKNIANDLLCTPTFVDLLWMENIDQIDNSSLHCFTCSCSFSSYLHAQEHLDREHSIKPENSLDQAVESVDSFETGDNKMSLNKPDNSVSIDQSVISTGTQISETNSTLSEESPESSSSELNNLFLDEFFKTYIFKGFSDDYYCFLCHKKFPFKFFPSNVKEHIEDANHQNLLKKSKDVKNIADESLCTKNFVELLSRTNIFQVDNSLLYCFTCSCFIRSYFQAQEHLDLEHITKHRNLLNQVFESVHSSETNSKSFLNETDNSVVISSNYSRVSKSKMIPMIETESVFYQYFDNFIFKDFKDYICHLCNKSLPSIVAVMEHMNNVNHQDELANQKKIIIFINTVPREPNVYEKLVRNNIFPFNFRFMKCFTCNTIFFSYKYAERHINSQQHLAYHGPILITSSKSVRQRPNLCPPEVLSNDLSAATSSQSSTCELILWDSARTEVESESLIPLPARSKEKKDLSSNALPLDLYQYNDAKKYSVHCDFCRKRVNSRVLLHVHLSSHFWQLFTDDNIKDLKSLVNLDSGILINFSGGTFCDGQVIPRVITGREDRSKIKNVSKAMKNRNLKNSVAYETRNKKRRKIKLKDLDIDQNDIEKKIDIYKIDEELCHSIQLSLNRVCIINKEEIYCMVCREKVTFSLRIVYEHFRSVQHSYFLMQMVQDHTKFESEPNELSDLHLAREMMEDKSDRHVVCYVCDPVKPFLIPNNIDALTIHIKLFKHQDKMHKLKNNLRQFISNFYSRLEYSWYNAQSYWCVVCTVQFRLENRFHKHLNSSAHQKKCAKFVTSENFVCDFCSTCGILLYGFKNTFTYHANCQFHRYYADKSFYLITRLPTAAEELLINAEQVMTIKLEELDEEAETMRKNEQLLLDDLKNTTSDYIDVKIHPFGSRITGLGSKNSDLDIFLDCDDLYYKGTVSDDISYYLKEVEHSLKQNESIWTIQRVITDCRIPIIKLVHQPTGIDCDLSFTSGLTTENTKLIKMYLDKYSLCKKLILFIKDWINICNLSGEDGISSYAIAWMVIYYLQTKFILPSVADLIKLEGKSCMISGWETGVSKSFTLLDITNDSSFKNLLRGFFIMCAGFDYRNNIFCPLLGRPIRKVDFIVPASLTNLPVEMLPYKNYIKKNKNLDAFRSDAAICVQDPFDLSHNLTKAVKKSTMHRFKTYCSLSTQKLMDNK
ncbi:uncharacterized protein LOC130669526 [Microplitis mediator]|uniref:uncharacterized protein LOC130669526 n=1 Tax=Microplitis mediator TaxID=375433 RepID=UPI0025534634|nr:uncharacterized protein LOC130669526 [Microplitis mediator]